MMRTIVALGLLYALTPPASFAEEFPQATQPYSANYTMHVDNQGQVADIRGKLEADGLKQRHEHNVAGTMGVLIMRGDKQVTWVLLPQQKMYIESSMDNQGKGPGASAKTFAQPRDVELKEIGTETINGYSTTKYEMSAMSHNETRVDGTLWLTEEKIPIRMEGKNEQGSFRRDLTNVKIGKIDPSRFELPVGYNLFSIPQIPQMPQGKGSAAMAEQMKQMMQNMKRR